jgi:ABC-2 type transport system ATP-binding protein
VIAGTVDDVVDAVGGGTCTTVRVDDPDAGARALRTAGYVVEQDGPLLRVAVASDAAADLTRVLAAADQWVSELRPERFTLEDVFLQLTGVAPGSDGARDGGTDEVVEVVA